MCKDYDERWIFDDKPPPEPTENTVTRNILSLSTIRHIPAPQSTQAYRIKVKRVIFSSRGSGGARDWLQVRPEAGRICIYTPGMPARRNHLHPCKARDTRRCGRGRNG